MGKWPRAVPGDEKGSHWKAARQEAQKAAWPEQRADRGHQEKYKIMRCDMFAHLQGLQIRWNM